MGDMILLRKYVYSATDKALFEALSQSKISGAELRDLFLSRGVIVSAKAERNSLAENFSRCIHDYYDHQRIANALGTIPRREKTASTHISGDYAFNSVEIAAEKLHNDILAQDDLCHLVHNDDGTFVIDITYESLDYGKSEFKQVVRKNAHIEVEKVDGHYVIRRPDNETLHNYVDQFLSYLEQEEDICSTRQDVDLRNIESPELRTRFFTLLINSLEGFKLDDVTDVYVYNPKKRDPFIDGSEEQAIEDAYHVTKVSLKGEGVLVSDELDSLYEKGFYIWKVRWRLLEDRADPDKFDFEAQFKDPEYFTGFSFIAKGAVRYKGNGEYNKSPSSLLPKEERDFTAKLEKSSLEIMEHIVELAYGEEDETPEIEGSEA
ncbi:hypothetical protein [Marisediminitalea sp.]|uniref:hypothetical protein n=1 Tax=Marisediminitalea sp. TaxID=2662268 RepID=UPI003516534A